MIYVVVDLYWDRSRELEFDFWVEQLFVRLYLTCIGTLDYYSPILLRIGGLNPKKDQYRGFEFIWLIKKISMKKQFIQTNIVIRSSC